MPGFRFQKQGMRCADTKHPPAFSRSRVLREGAGLRDSAYEIKDYCRHGKTKGNQAVLVCQTGARCAALGFACDGMPAFSFDYFRYARRAVRGGNGRLSSGRPVRCIRYAARAGRGTAKPVACTVRQYGPCGCRCAGFPDDAVYPRNACGCRFQEQLDGVFQLPGLHYGRGHAAAFCRQHGERPGARRADPQI